MCIFREIYDIFFGGWRKRWLYRMWYTFMREFLYFSWCVIAFYLLHVMSWFIPKCTRVVEVETREMDFQMLPFHAHLNCADWLYLIVLPWIQGQWSCFLGRWKYWRYVICLCWYVTLHRLTLIPVKSRLFTVKPYKQTWPIQVVMRSCHKSHKSQRLLLPTP